MKTVYPDYVKVWQSQGPFAHPKILAIAIFS